MKLNFKFKRFCFILVFFLILIFQSDIPNLKAQTMDNHQTEMVIEELRLKVPADSKTVWLNAEKRIWDPWLSSQDGFLGRQLFWDKEKEEVNALQQKFEENVKAALNVRENPFELIYEGELDKQE